MGIIQLRNNVFSIINKVSSLEEYKKAKEEFENLCNDSRYVDEEDQKRLFNMLQDKYNVIYENMNAKYDRLLQEKQEKESEIYDNTKDNIDYNKVEMSSIKLINELLPIINSTNGNKVGIANNIIKSYSESNQVNALAVLRACALNNNISEIILESNRQIALNNSKSLEEKLFDKYKAKTLEEINKKLAEAYSKCHLMRVNKRISEKANIRVNEEEKVKSYYFSN